MAKSKTKSSNTHDKQIGIETLKLMKESGYNYRERRHADWDENYTLGRDKVTINRLLQRQSVNLPMMKLTLKTLLKDYDDMPVVYFENLDNDKDAEIFKNEYWKHTGEINNFELQDIVDKKQEFYFGRTFDQWQVVDGKIKMTVTDPMDMLVDRYMDPFNLHTSRFLIHQHIFMALSDLEKNTDYDRQAIKDIKAFYATDLGLLKATDNLGALQARNQKMADMGVSDIDSPVLGETYVELTMYFTYDKKSGSDEEELFLKVTCDDKELLLDKPLEEIIGETPDHYWRTHYPYVSWAGDVERQDFWSDGTADMVRTPNKILNAWFSQLVENRSLKNLNMNLFDSSIEGFSPQTWQPIAWGMYGVPVPQGKRMEDVFKQLTVSDLSESLDEMQFVITMIEKGTGATATEQGAKTAGQVTLGEVQLALGQAKERIKGMSKFYTKAWKDRGTIFIKLLEASGDKIDAVKIYKKGRNTSNIYSREIGPNDWKSKEGYRCEVWDQAEKEAENTDSLNKLNAAKTIMPTNLALTEIYNRKILEFSALEPDDINRVLEEEKVKQDQMMMATGGASALPPQQMPQQGGVPPAVAVNNQIAPQ